MIMNPIEGTTASSQTKSEDSSDSPKPHKPTTQPPEKTAEVEEDSSEMQHQMPDEIPDLYCYTPQDTLSEDDDAEGMLLGPETDSVEIQQIPSEDASKNPKPMNLPLIQTNGPLAIPPHQQAN